MHPISRKRVPRWSGPIRPTLAAGVWQGSEARRAGARPGMHTKAGGKERCLRHSARASTYGQAVLRMESNLIDARPARARSHYYTGPHSSSCPAPRVSPLSCQPHASYTRAGTDNLSCVHPFLSSSATLTPRPAFMPMLRAGTHCASRLKSLQIGCSCRVTRTNIRASQS